MITIRLVGGLGNQMFQYAYGMSLEARGFEVQYTIGGLVEGTHREYSLGYFGNIKMGKPTGPRLQEGDPQYDHLLATVNPINLLGYWQSEKYFEKIKDQVREFFQFKAPRNAYIEEPLWKARNTDSVCLHVRRQDYLELQHFHGMPPIEYYRKALTFLPYSVNRQVFVISDDREWCIENFPREFWVVGGTKYEDMQLMAACKHAVIANSSFSWWGAWLGDAGMRWPNRVVVAPEKWFADTSVPSAHIVPDRWVKI